MFELILFTRKILSYHQDNEQTLSANESEKCPDDESPADKSPGGQNSQTTKAPLALINKENISESQQT